MAHSSQRSYEERTSSYKRQFGDGPNRFTYTPKTPNNKQASSSRTFRFSSSSTSNAAGAGPSTSSGIRATRAVPVSAAISMKDINSLADSMGHDFQDMRVNEKEELRVLNSRFAGYITKVRGLEQANKVLEAKVDQLSASQPGRLADMYEEELSRLRREVDRITNEKDSVALQLDNALGDAAKYKKQNEEEAVMRQELENDLNDMRKDCDDATLVRLDLERRLETLTEEIEFLKRMHEEEITDLREQLSRSEIKIEMAPGPDLEEILDDVRLQYEKMSAQNKADAEQWYTEKVDGLQQQAARNDESLRNTRQEINEYRKTVQTLNLEMDSLRGTNDSLQRSLSELENRYNVDSSDYQDTITNLQNECEDLKAQMGQHLRQYQELMDVKMALDIEIATYRKLLEGEESRVEEERRIAERIKSMQIHSTPAYTTSSARKGYSGQVSSSSGLQQSDDVETVTTKKVVVKTIETKDGRVVSQSEDIREQSSGDHDDQVHPSF